MMSFRRFAALVLLFRRSLSGVEMTGGTPVYPGAGQYFKIINCF
jgi:hypothetical protein